MKRWVFVVSLLAAFILGLLVGVVGVVGYVTHHINRVMREGPTAAREMMVKKLTRDLKLTAGQRDLIEPIIGTAHEKLLRLRKQHDPEVDAIFRRCMEEMKPQLNPEQQTKLEQLYEQIRKRWRLNTGEGDSAAVDK